VLLRTSIYNDALRQYTFTLLSLSLWISAESRQKHLPACSPLRAAASSSFASLARGSHVKTSCYLPFSRPTGMFMIELRYLLAGQASLFLTEMHTLTLFGHLCVLFACTGRSR
jgi:hypothetical protein